MNEADVQTRICSGSLRRLLALRRWAAAGHRFAVIEGSYCSRETIACQQEICPDGAGRTYTLECCCDCWDDKSKTNLYDPCRAGFLLKCIPAVP